MTKLKLYLLTDPEECDYDEYDSAVVAACNETEARKIHPDGESWNDEKGEWESGWHAWPHIDKVECKYIGEATEGIEKGVICFSFNAG